MAESKASGVGADNRPKSPHLQVYRWEITMFTSIMHRVTGVGLYIGTLILAWWLIALASGPEAYAVFQDVAGSLLGRFVLFMYTLTITYHMLNGIRHLYWDVGYGFAPGTASLTGWTVVLSAIVVTVLIWAAGYGLIGG